MFVRGFLLISTSCRSVHLIGFSGNLSSNCRLIRKRLEGLRQWKSLEITMTCNGNNNKQTSNTNHNIFKPIKTRQMTWIIQGERIYITMKKNNTWVKYLLFSETVEASITRNIKQIYRVKSTLFIKQHQYKVNQEFIFQRYFPTYQY